MGTGDRPVEHQGKGLITEMGPSRAKSILEVEEQWNLLTRTMAVRMEIGRWNLRQTNHLDV